MKIKSSLTLPFAFSTQLSKFEQNIEKRETRTNDLTYSSVKTIVKHQLYIVAKYLSVAMVTDNCKSANMFMKQKMRNNSPDCGTSVMKDKYSFRFQVNSGQIYN